MVLLGMRKEVLSSSLPWLCSQCYTCQAHCPQNVNFADVMKALRNMAVREGYVHPSFVKKVKEIDIFCQKLRHQMVLSIVDNKSQETDVKVARLADQALDEEKAKV